MIKIVILVLLAIFKDDGDQEASLHYRVAAPFTTMEDCEAAKATIAQRIIPPDATISSAVCYAQALYPKKSI